MTALGFLLGLLRAGLGGLQWFLSPPKPGKANWGHRENRWGLDDPRLAPDLQRVHDATLLGLGDSEGILHALLNFVVEWNRLNAQRGAKLFGMLLLVSWGGTLFGLMLTLCIYWVIN